MKTNWDYTNLADAYLKRPDYSNTAIDAMLSISKLSVKANICDVGAGVGHLTLVLANKGFQIKAVEPNDAMRSIGKIRTKDFKNINWHEGTGEETGQQSNSFQMVTFGSSFNVCDRKKALIETSRILKPKGKFIFIEPLGTNPIINFYRKITPNSRSEDEHPLVKQDFDLIKKKFNKIDVKYYGFFTLIFFPFYLKPVNSFVFKFLNKLDQVFFKINIFKNFAWSVLIIAEKD